MAAAVTADRDDTQLKKQAFIFLKDTVITVKFVFHCSMSSSAEEMRHLVSFQINNYIW